MAVELNHTIVHVRNQQESAEFVADILGLEPEPRWGPFLPVQLANHVALDFMDHPDPPMQHYAFKLSGDEWEAARRRLLDRHVPTWGDPHMSEPGGVYEVGGEKGTYFQEPSGHLLEIITDA
ncbi:MAG: VOC family protein [Acidimicrobiia bacterium]|nr:VOC family protein [Acidimicrobiia bacterium]